MIDVSFLSDAILINLVVGILAGALRSVIGWLESGEVFESRKFLLTLIRTSMLGAIIGYSSTGTPVNLFFEVFVADFTVLGLKKIEEVRTGKVPEVV